ncbi:hypothetical protein IQE94_05560 [Synechocystis sp. PCC 7339]|uniref:hypothetical protein n=1 Tax=Synechocystis sp. PCC 7339 TaxID=2782213 RepID=UPI001CBC3B98|nr:hypothetical protein [Synechocystis sp. PCC 7339]UAJ73749.1 hypothetical protein IQE94_05560 [Synechocystis sp. PCC 7339]
MAKYSNTIYFSLDKEARERLESYSSDGESLGLTAKRLILDIIGGDRQSSPMSPDLDDRLSELSDRLTSLEKRLILTEDGEKRDRLEKIEKHLDWAKREILDHREKLKDLEHQAHWGGDKPPETTIMIQKQPLPPTMEIMRTHEEAANDWGKSLATVRRWAKDPDKWPEGWLWDGDRNFWVKEV